MRLTVVALVAVGCSGGKGGTGDTGSTFGLPKVECGTLACDPTDSYCIESFYGGDLVDSWCAPTPADCPNCTCTYEDAAAAWLEDQGLHDCTGVVVGSECNFEDGVSSALVSCGS